MPDSRVRCNQIYTLVAVEMGATGAAAQLGVSNAWFYINAGYNLFSLAHPNGWRWQRYRCTKANEDHSVALDSTLVSATVLPRWDLPRWVVETRNGDTGAYRTLEYVPRERWAEEMSAPRAHSARNQDIWTVINEDNDTANLVTGPGTYATGVLDYKIDMLQELQTLSSTGANDDSKLLPPAKDDVCIVRGALVQIAQAIGDDNLLARSWQSFEMECLSRLAPLGIYTLGLKKPPGRAFAVPDAIEEEGGR